MKGNAVLQQTMITQYSFDVGSGIYLNDRNEICAPGGVVITKTFLLMALKYQSEEELINSLKISKEDLKILLRMFDINLKKEVRLTEVKTRILGIIQRYAEKYEGQLPTITYIKKKLKMDISDLINELKELDQMGYIKFTFEEGIKKITREF